MIYVQRRDILPINTFTKSFSRKKTAFVMDNCVAFVYIYPKSENCTLPTVFLRISCYMHTVKTEKQKFNFETNLKEKVKIPKL